MPYTKTQENSMDSPKPKLQWPSKRWYQIFLIFGVFAFVTQLYILGGQLFNEERMEFQSPSLWLTIATAISGLFWIILVAQNRSWWGLSVVLYWSASMVKRIAEYMPSDMRMPLEILITLLYASTFVFMGLGILYGELNKKKDDETKPHLMLAHRQDLSTILALQKLAYHSEGQRYDDFTIPPLTQTLDEIQADFAQVVFLKAVIEDRIVGSVRGYEKDSTCYIGRIIVHPEFQNQGIGTQLIQAIEQHFAHVTRFELFTGHKSENALHLYQKLGYQEFKRKELQTHTLVFLEKTVIEISKEEFINGLNRF